MPVMTVYPAKTSAYVIEDAGRFRKKILIAKVLKLEVTILECCLKALMKSFAYWSKAVKNYHWLSFMQDKY